MKLRRVLFGYTHTGRTGSQKNSLNKMKGVDQKHGCCKILVHKVSNIIRRHRKYEVAAYMYFTIITFFHIL
jgi:hypothetical protein